VEVLLKGWSVVSFPVGVLVGVLSQIKPTKQIRHYCSESGGEEHSAQVS
jgi:hypothetical protein